MNETLPPLEPAQLVANRARRLAGIGYAGVGLAAGYFWFYSPWSDPLLTLMGILMGSLGVLPILFWLHRNDHAYPLPELMQLTFVPFYAMPLLTGHEEVSRYRESVLLEAAFIVVIFQVLFILGSITVDRNHRDRPQRPWWTDDLVSEGSLRFSGYTFMLSTAWLVLSNFTHWIPSELFGTMRAIFFGIGTISAFIQARLWGAGQLNQSHKILLVVNVLVQFILMNLSLVLVTSMIMMLVLFIGYFSSARNLPWAVCLATLACLAILHNGKHKMRDKYWGEEGRDVAFTAVPDYYSQWIEYGLEATRKGVEKAENTAKRSSLFERASLFQLVCYAVDTVPDLSPYLYGDSYSYVLPQVVPRFLWPNKPSPNDSVKLLSVRLGVLTAEQAEYTSIGYGLITEAYANYGSYGSAVLGFVLGWVLRKVARNTSQCGTLSGGGIFRILCLAWVLNAETTLAVWLSSFYQACIAIYFPLLFYSSLLR